MDGFTASHGLEWPIATINIEQMKEYSAGCKIQAFANSAFTTRRNNLPVSL